MMSFSPIEASAKRRNFKTSFKQETFALISLLNYFHSDAYQGWSLIPLLTYYIKPIKTLNIPLILDRCNEPYHNIHKILRILLTCALRAQVKNLKGKTIFLTCNKLGAQLLKQKLLYEVF
jgi:hypothetical protein